MMTINPIRIATISLAAALALSTNVRADDGGLYEKPLDPKLGLCPRHRSGGDQRLRSEQCLQQAERRRLALRGGSTG